MATGLPSTSQQINVGRVRASAMLALLLCSLVTAFLILVAIDGEGDWQVFLVLTVIPTALFLVNAVAAVTRPTRGAALRLIAFWLVTLLVDLWLLSDLVGLADHQSVRPGLFAILTATAAVSVIGAVLCIRVQPEQPGREGSEQ